MMEIMGETSAQVTFAGFWRRFGAILIDGLVLGIAGWMIGVIFYDQLTQVGMLGRLIGFPIAALYFAVLEGRSGGGASLGKRILALQVVARNGRPVSLGRSVWRTIVYLIPFYLNGIDFSFLHLKGSAFTIFAAVDMFLVFGILGASLYLYLANWRTRQVIQDLVSATFVVHRADAPGRITERINPVHLIFVLLWLALSAAIMPLAMRDGGKTVRSWLGPTLSHAANQADSAAQIAAKEPGVLTANSAIGSTTVTSTKGTTTTSFLKVVIVTRGPIANRQQLANIVAAHILAAHPHIFGQQILTIIVRTGFDIGIASSWTAERYSFSLKGWNERLQAKKPGRSA